MQLFRAVIVLGFVTLLACGGGGSAVGSPDAGATSLDAGQPAPDARSPMSDELIAAAVAAGKIGDETALVYLVFAAFGDPRLPAEYQGAGARSGTSALAEATFRWDSLSTDTRATLAPFRIPPSAPGSWLELRGPASDAKRQLLADHTEIHWTKVTAQGGDVTIWSEDRYPGEDELARSIAAELDSRIWPALFDDGLGMRLPLSDSGHANNGGDGSIDIYLVHLGTDGEYGLTSFYDDAAPGTLCGPRATYMLINSEHTGKTLFPTVAHELMHAAQFAYKTQGACLSYQFWREATATWVEDWVYPKRNTEQEYATDLLDHTDQPLEEYQQGSLHQYGAYLFPFLIHRKYADPKFVSRSWELAETAGALDAIAQAAAAANPNGMAEVFAEFALRNWNQGPVVDYETWDGIIAAPSKQETYTIRTDTDQEPVDTTTQHLAARYVRISIADHDVRTITIDNDIVAGQVAGGHVWLIPNIGGAWKAPETLGDQKKYCRDHPDENLEEAILVVSNAVWDDASHVIPGGRIRLSGSANGCEQTWSGTIHVVASFMATTYNDTPVWVEEGQSSAHGDQLWTFGMTQRMTSGTQTYDYVDLTWRANHSETDTDTITPKSGTCGSSTDKNGSGGDAMPSGLIISGAAGRYFLQFAAPAHGFEVPITVVSSGCNGTSTTTETVDIFEDVSVEMAMDLMALKPSPTDPNLFEGRVTLNHTEESTGVGSIVSDRTLDWSIRRNPGPPSGAQGAKGSAGGAW